jgi:hypothetical protein
MTSGIGQPQSERFLTIRNAWMEGNAPMPRDPVSVFETNFNNLLNLLVGKETSTHLSPEGSAARPVTIVNKLSDKALEVESASIHRVARIFQVTRNAAPNQRRLCGV